MQFFFLIWLVLFAAVVLAVSLGVRLMESSRRKKVSEILSAVTSAVRTEKIALLRDMPKNIGGMRHTLLERFPMHDAIAARLQEAGLAWPVWLLPVLMLLGAVVGVLVGMLFHVPVYRQFAMLVFGIFGALMPHGYVSLKRGARLRAFEQQFPEALDFLARSMRAGHAFSVSMEMLSEEAVDPLGTEFRRVFHEQNLGAPLESALRSLAMRVPLVDVGFFVSAVLLQRETGGNLAEILTKLAYVIRERFRLKGQVRAASAHGRLTAGVLTALPILTTIALLIIAPGYLESMAKDYHGQYFIIGAIIAQFVGYAIMRRIVSIKV